MKNDRINEIFHGFVITNVAIEHSSRIAFITKEVPTEAKSKKLGYDPGDDELATRIVLYNLMAIWATEKDNFVSKGWSVGVRRAYVAFTGEQDTGNLVVCGVEGSGTAFMSEGPLDDNWYDRPMKPVKPFDNHKAMLAATNIDGEVYFAGRLRKLFKRVGKNQWIDLTDEKAHPYLFTDIAQARKQGRKPISMPMGFHAVDGFGKNDIYCCGHKSDLWHYDGTRWRRLDPPANFDMECIACAADGHVYIAGALGGIVKGRFDPKTSKERWQLIESGVWNTDTRFNSLAWFQGRLYLATDWALYYLGEQDKLHKYEFPKGGFEQYSFQHVTACDTALLSYGPYQALVHDGNQWEQIVGGIVVPA